MYIAVFSAEHNYDQKDAGNIRDRLKTGGVRSKLGHSCYVGHKSVEVHVLDLLKASAVLIAGSRRGDLDRYIARCCRDKFRDNKHLVREARRNQKGRKP